jgi:TolA-binding protein
LKLSLQKNQQKLKSEQFELALMRRNFEDFKINLALTLPDIKVPTEKKFQVRNLASVVTTPLEPLRIDGSASLLGKARQKFAARDFEPAIESLRRIVSQYPYSDQAIEAHFLLAESLYQVKRFSETLKVVDEMLTLFPENDLTGFILLRMGQVYVYQNRANEAIDVYQTVIKNFNNADLKKQAEKLLRQAES